MSDEEFEDEPCPECGGEDGDHEDDCELES